MQAAFAEPGGEALRRWIDNCPNQMYAALCFQGGAAFRKHLQDDIGDQGQVTQLIDRRSDDELLALMSNLGGHDMASMIEAFEAIDHDRPVCFIAYTIKGVGLPMQGHKDNHAGLDDGRRRWRSGAPRRTSAPATNGRSSRGCRRTPAELEAFLAEAPFNREGRRRLTAPVIEVPQQLAFKPAAQMSTQQGFGLVLNELARGDTELAVAHRHRVARRHGLDQSRRLGQPPRAVCQGREPRPVPAGEDPLDLQLGLFARRASTSNSASPR